MERQRPTERQINRPLDYRREAKGDAICAGLFAGLFGFFANKNSLSLAMISGLLVPAYSINSLRNFRKSKAQKSS